MCLQFQQLLSPVVKLKHQDSDAQTHQVYQVCFFKFMKFVGHSGIQWKGFDKIGRKGEREKKQETQRIVCKLFRPLTPFPQHPFPCEKRRNLPPALQGWVKRYICFELFHTLAFTLRKTTSKVQSFASTVWIFVTC